MERKTYLSRYRLALDLNGAPFQLRHSAAGMTYKGEDIVSGQEVAVDLVPAGTLRPDVREQLEQEANVAKQIDHINIPVLHAFGIEGDEMVYVSEFFEGTTAENWVKSHGPLPTATMLRVALQAVSALGAATFHGIVHFAINPTNLMLVPGQTPQGDWPLIKVLNFIGLAPAMETSRSAAADRTAAVHFASPEQLRDGTVNFRAEMYSLGCTLWYLLTGARPIAGAATVEEASGMAGPVKRLLMEMLAVDPNERPLDPLALQEQIRDCVSHLERLQSVASKFGLAAPSSTTPIQAAAPAPVVRHRASPVRSLALAALLLGLGVLAGTMLPDWLHGKRGVVNRERKPIGIPVGVPESELSSSVADNEPANPRPSEPSDAPEVPAAPAVVAAATEGPIVPEEPSPAASPLDVSSAPLLANSADDALSAPEPSSVEQPGSTVVPTAKIPLRDAANPPVLVSITEPGSNEGTGTDAQAKQKTEEPTEVAAASSPLPPPDMQPASPDERQEDQGAITGNVQSAPHTVAEPSPSEEGPVEVASSAPSTISYPAVQPDIAPIPSETAAEDQDVSPATIASNVTAESGLPVAGAATEPASPEEGPVEVASSAPSTNNYSAVQPDLVPIPGELAAEDQDVAPATSEPVAEGQGTTAVAAAPKISEEPVGDGPGSAPPPVPITESRKVAASKAKTKGRVAAKKGASTEKTSRVASSSSAGPLPRGVVRAQFLGTTPEGNLIFGLPSSERGYLAAPSSGRESSRRRNRRAAEPTQELPVLRALPPDE